MYVHRPAEEERQTGGIASGVRQPAAHSRRARKSAVATARGVAGTQFSPMPMRRAVCDARTCARIFSSVCWFTNRKAHRRPCPCPRTLLGADWEKLLQPRAA